MPMVKEMQQFTVIKISISIKGYRKCTAEDPCFLQECEHASTETFNAAAFIVILHNVLCDRSTKPGQYIFPFNFNVEALS